MPKLQYKYIAAPSNSITLSGWMHWKIKIANIAPPAGATFVNFTIRFSSIKYTTNTTNPYLSMGVFLHNGDRVSTACKLPKGTNITSLADVVMTNSKLDIRNQGNNQQEIFAIYALGANITNLSVCFIWTYQVSASVTKGDIIKATDWTNIGLSATIGDKIVRAAIISGSFSAIIYAKQWNNIVLSDFSSTNILISAQTGTGTGK